MGFSNQILTHFCLLIIFYIIYSPELVLRRTVRVRVAVSGAICIKQTVSRTQINVCLFTTAQTKTPHTVTLRRFLGVGFCCVVEFAASKNRAKSELEISIFSLDET